MPSGKSGSNMHVNRTRRENPCMRPALALLCVHSVLGANPLVPRVGMADANVHFFNGTFMSFATHDFSSNNTGFLMKDWWVWTSPDLLDWTLASVVSPQASLKWDTSVNECWATDAAFANNKFYFYLSAGGGQIGVVVSNSIQGPWYDPLGKPLMSSAFGQQQNPPTTFRDPCVFHDPENGEYYMIAGVFTYYITKLNKDMISFAEKPQLVNFTNHVYGPCGDGKTDDKPFMHKNSGTGIYYLSWGCFYATSTSVYGPFTMQGAVINASRISPDFQCDGQAHQCGRDAAAIAAVAPTATAPQRARAMALAAASTASSAATRSGGALPQPGDAILLVRCSSVPATATGWTQRGGGAGWAPGLPFQLSLSANLSLCIEAHAPMHRGGVGERLTLQRCDERNASVGTRARGKLQHFTRNVTAHGDDVTGPADGPQHCPCWNVNVNNPSHPTEPNTAVPYVQCMDCVDGPPYFNTNQRFTFPADAGAGQIQAWEGFAPGWCVAAVPPPSPPWFLEEDYTDRHGSFLEHRGQWYFFSNDRSHSGDMGHEGVFRDTVGCYIHFRANGTMDPCYIDGQGVNQHNISFSDGRSASLEAENFFSMQGGGAEKVDLLDAGGGEGFAVSGGHGTVLRYPKVVGFNEHAHSNAKVILRVASIGDANTRVDIFAKRTTGGAKSLLARCRTPTTGGLTVYADIACEWSPDAADVVRVEMERGMELVLMVRAYSQHVIRLDKIWLGSYSS